jgi:hypothetical protein
MEMFSKVISKTTKGTMEYTTTKMTMFMKGIGGMMLRMVWEN